MRDDDYFKGMNRKTVDIQGQPVAFPVCYFDFRLISAAFIVKADRLKEILPHPHFLPAEIWPGSSVLSITAFEYRDTEIGPYNELSVAVPINFEPATFLPSKSAISMLRRHKYAVYIKHLPVTTEIARKGGVFFYNYPKFLADIVFHDSDDRLEVTISENNHLILKMTARKPPLKKSGVFEYHTFSLKNNEILHTLIEGKAKRLGYSMMGKFAEIELGEHPMSKELERLQLGKVAHSGNYAEGAMGKLYYPDRRWDVETLAPIEEQT